MPTTQISCPNCRQQIIADIEQLFDVGEDPTAKQQLLSGAFNMAHCPHCGFQGNLSTPIVYHDPNEELLLTFVPPEVGLPRDEQERIIGRLINKIIDRLPQEKRKGYLLQPKANLSMQSLIERILVVDGITPEMIEAQQKRLQLLQQLVSTTDVEKRTGLFEQEKELIDGDFFNLLTRLLETARMSNDEESAKRLGSLRDELLEKTEFGHQIKEQTEEVQAAIKSLQEAGKEITREKLLEIVIDAPNDTRLSSLVSLVRSGMDYQFFQLLTERIDRGRGTGRKRLVDLRERLLEFTRQYDEEMEARVGEVRQLINGLLQAEDIGEATSQVLPVVDEIFVRVLNEEIEAVRGRGDLEKLGKLQEVMKLVEQVSAPPPEVALIQELLSAPDDQALRRLMEEYREEITPEFFGILSSIMTQVEQAGEDEELVGRLRALNRQVMRFSMEANLRGS